MRHVLEDFEGFVLEQDTENDRDTFWVRLVDQDEEETEGAVLREKIPKTEHKYIQPGAHFHWTIFSDGTYDFKFSREVWTSEQIDELNRIAEDLLQKITLGKTHE